MGLDENSIFNTVYIMLNQNQLLNLQSKKL